MANCTSIDPLVTPYVDGELSGAERRMVDEHLNRCPPCHSRVAAEGAVRALLHAQKSGLVSDVAPPQLRTRCGSLASSIRPAAAPNPLAPTPRVSRHLPLVSLALAAGVIMLVGGTVVYQATDRSALVMAAELAADHVKCFAANEVLGTHDDPTQVEAAMFSGFDWRLHLPQHLTDAGFELVGARRCLYGEGKIAHIMYRQQGRPVSVFMLPRSTRSEDMVDVLGHEAAIWSEGDRTFVLVTRGSRSDVQRMASVVKASFH